MKRAILTLLLLTLAASVAGTPRANAQKGGGYLDNRSDLETGAVITQPAVPRGASSVLDATSMPAPSGAIGTVVYSASATWCAPTPTRCQNWGGNARLAAVNSFRFGDEPYPVRVWRGDMYVDVTVVSFCACRGTLHAIDLSPAAWTVLEPDLGVGRIDVVVEVLVDLPPDPADERMRAEDRGLPATDMEDR